ncbi:MAG: CidB/LrgB family autolysis modulator [Desulfuromonadales bacterium C00003068]|jgi:predicted murein hydrolase (TIGR00659 family)|nr:MAG: CidB/LrgB family autolysis modulator [Desulfuromonadales bacterium C00003068]
MTNSLLSSPLFGITLTLITFQLAVIVHKRFRYTILNPAIVSIVSVIVILKQCNISYQNYSVGGDIILFLLGPSVVALGVPLYQRRAEVKQRLVPILAGISAGSVVSIITASGIILLMGGSEQLALTVAPKSVTTPIAIGISAKFGGIVPLTAAIVVATGCFGAVVGPSFCRLLGVDDPASMGLAMGTAAHGIGTGRMLEIDLLGGAIAGLAIGLSGVITSILMPLLALILN